MSNNTIQLTLKATDNASSVVVGASDKIASSLKGVTEGIKQQTMDYKGLVVGISGAATASFGLYNAFDNVMDASVGVNKANLAVKSSTNAVEDAQTRYNAVVAKYGPASAEALASSKDLALAQERASVAVERADVNGFINYVDFNKCVHFITPEDEESQSNLKITQAEDVLQITNRDVDEILNAITVKGESYTATAEDAASIAANYRRERTFNEPSLTSEPAVQARADELLAKYKDAAKEIPIKLGEVFVLEMFDRLTVDCSEVGLNNEEIWVLSTNYAFSNGGYRTSISGVHKNFSISELFADYSTKLAGVS